MARHFHSIGFIGAGRTGATLSLGLHQAGYTVAAIANRSVSPARNLAAKIPGCVALESPAEAVEDCDLIFLTVPDGAITPLATSLPWRKGQAAVHCSGALSSTALAPVVRRGALAGCLHPLQTFASKEGEVEKLAGSAFAVEGEGLLREWLEEAAQRLGGFPVFIKAEDKALYHASAVMACGYLATLLDAACDLWEAMGFSREEGMKALLPLVRGTVENVVEHGPRLGATGPILRGDTGTVRRHLEALHERAPEVLALYCQAGLAMVDLAQTRGSLNLGQAKELRGLLTSPWQEPTQKPSLLSGGGVFVGQ